MLGLNPPLQLIANYRLLEDEQGRLVCRDETLCMPAAIMR